MFVCFFWSHFSILLQKPSSPESEKSQEVHVNGTTPKNVPEDEGKIDEEDDDDNIFKGIYIYI